MHAYYSSAGRQAPAREIIEQNLIELYHWLPQDIDKIPYHKLQKLFLVRQEKNAAVEIKASVAQVQAANAPRTKGKGQKRYRTL